MKAALSVSEQKYITILPIVGNEWSILEGADMDALAGHYFIGHKASRNLLSGPLQANFMDLACIGGDGSLPESHANSLFFLLRKDELYPSELKTLRLLAENGYHFRLVNMDDFLKGNSVKGSKRFSKNIIRKFKTDRQLFDFVSCHVDSIRQLHGTSDHTNSRYMVPVPDACDPDLIHQELMALGESHLFIEKLNYQVYISREDPIPNCLQEIGRLREKTFRQVGEGTGKASDIDEFDKFYYHLIIYDKEEKQIVGGYRLGYGNELFRRFGKDGFYIAKLFDIDPRFHPVLQSSVELGRSYITPPYQRKRLPLFLLWKGILQFIITYPDIKYIYGPVSISKFYSDISKSFIIEFLKRHYFNTQLAELIRPRKAFTPKFESINYQEMLEGMDGRIQELDNFIEEIDPYFFNIPVLMRQYMRQNAKFVGFNVDPNFSDALDGFMVLDIQNLPKSTIEALNQK